MWFVYSKKDNVSHTHGLTGQCFGEEVLYTSNEKVALNDVQGLAEVEYQQAVALHRTKRSVKFGRDYLGHYPLLYAYTIDAVIISDDLGEIQAWLNKNGQTLTLSTLSVAFYISMGYVPQGFSLFNEIHSCRNTSHYEWSDGKVTEIDIFTPIETNDDCQLADVNSALEIEIENIYRENNPVDVWCSGGLDSSIIAMLCNRRGRQADLLTLQHTDDFKLGFGEGELPYAVELARHLNANLRTVEFSPSAFNYSYYDFLSLHPTPVLDPVVTPKYMLARQTRSVAVTGEGGDPIFAGVKNNAVTFMHDKNPELSFGTIYALAHLRFHAQLDEILVQGKDLQDSINKYLKDLWDKYPGSIAKKLFYMNTLEKQGGMIFPKNYYAGKYGGVEVRHPMTSMEVYKAAFALRDDLKYQYPRGKLALINLYESELPASIVNRKKSGTLVPMSEFLKNIHKGKFEFGELLKSGMFKSEFLEKLSSSDVAQLDNSSVFMLYAMLSLNKWLESNGGGKNATSNISTCAGNL